MTEQQIQMVLTFWSLGRDTNYIARIVGVDEAIVANELPALLEQRRPPPVPRVQKSAVKLYANKLRRCGIPKGVIKIEVAKMEAAR